MFHLDEFWFKPYDEDTIIESKEASFAESILVWIQSEAKDEDDRTAVLRKMIKNIRWLSQKVNCTTIILHSFAHLGESKSDSDFADSIIEETATRLRDRDFTVHIIPLGLNEFKMHVRGPSLSKVFKAF